ncbi:MAG: DUF4402 domain-containing protein [Marinilabiliales bacterium]|nr:DUF4402 domain-containing protein [Marinilabiliales bacterium]
MQKIRDEIRVIVGRFLPMMISALLMSMTTFVLQAQEKPPRPIQVFVNPTQGLIFGAFTHGASGGTVTISPTGMRSSTGSVVLLSLGYNFSPAIFQVEGIKGTVISITDNSGTAFTLTGSHGGTLTLHLGPPQSNTSCGTPFILDQESPLRMEIRVGGTLSVGNSAANPPGNYSGTFNLTFNQE